MKAFDRSGYLTAILLLCPSISVTAKTNMLSRAFKEHQVKQAVHREKQGICTWSTLLLFLIFFLQNG